MTKPLTLKVLTSKGLQEFLNLQSDAVKTVSERFYNSHGDFYERFGARGRDLCREDIAFHLEFLRPVVEFGLLQPMVDYLCWISSVFATKGIPLDHLTLSLQWIEEFFAEQMDETESTVVTAALQAARMAYLNIGGTPLQPMQSPAPLPEALVFENALLAGNQIEALIIANQLLDSGKSLAEVEVHVIQPALYSIGDKWQANQVSVAQEHVATAIAHSIMSNLLLKFTPPDSVNKKVLLACVEGNHHEVGLRMVADSFLLAGWEIEYLGADTSNLTVVQKVVECKPDLIGLSVSFSHQLPAVRAVITQLNELLGIQRPAVIVGGLAMNRFSQLADVVGSNGMSADAESVVHCANKLVKDR